MPFFKLVADVGRYSPLWVVLAVPGQLVLASVRKQAALVMLNK